MNQPSDSHCLPPALAADGSTVKAMSFIIINSDASLATMVEACQAQAAIALDTEFIRTDTFYPKPALLQIYDGHQVYLIDPLAISDFTPLKYLFNDTSTIKVMHSCSEDMEVFARLLQCYPQPLVDTQIAASLVGMDFSISYQRLVETVLDKQLDKGETRSDWLRRPLSDKQLSYAADDVLWLLDIFDYLQQRLTALGRYSWLQEECADLLERAQQPVDHDVYYLKIKSAWRLGPCALNALRALCAWREREARGKNVPRSRIVSDASLVELAKIRPGNKAALAKITDMRHATVRHYGERIIELLNNAEAMPSEQWPAAIQPKNSLELRKTLKKLKQRVAEYAQKLDIPEGMLARKRDLEAYVAASNRSSELLGRGWRSEVFANALEPIVQRYVEQKHAEKKHVEQKYVEQKDAE